MLKKIALLSLLTIISAFSYAQKNWVKQKLATRFVASFPTTPTQTASTTYALKDTTNTIFTATYSAIAQNLNVQPKAFARLATTTEFATDFLNSLQATLLAYDLSEIKINAEKNFVSYTLNGPNRDAESTIFLKIIFIDGVYYSLSCVLPNQLSPKQKDLFLTGFQILK